ncbi:TetR family transcriptional regulator [Thermaerobacter sp. FW80]|nr:TetR family transcriptional regulator [Thermaerobacter sp. FW80]
MRGGASEASTRGGRGRPGPMAAPTVNPGHRRGAVRTPVAARIREAAAELFARQGFRGTGLRQVAAAAGVAVGTVYAHYRDKAALLRSVAEEQAAVIGRRLAPVHLTPGRPAAERWAAFRDVLRDALPWLACEAEAGAAVARGAGQRGEDRQGPVTAALHQGLARLLLEGARRGEVELPHLRPDAGRPALPAAAVEAAAGDAAAAVLAAALGLWERGRADDLDWLWWGLAARGPRQHEGTR